MFSSFPLALLERCEGEGREHTSRVYIACPVLDQLISLECHRLDVEGEGSVHQPLSASYMSLLWSGRMILSTHFVQIAL